MITRVYPLIACLVLVLAGLTLAQTMLPSPIPFPVNEVLFSVNPPAPDLGAPTPAFTDGDLLSERGAVVATNSSLMRSFHPMPPKLDNCGLDAIVEVLPLPIMPPVPAGPRYLFSTNVGFFDEQLNRQISDGDLLADNGQVYATNAQLMANFHPMPPKPDVGLDAVCRPTYRLPVGPQPVGALPPEIWFSTNRGWFDEVLGRYISDGDLLSTTGRVIATNQQLVRNFHPAPTTTPVAGFGLDAVFVPQFNPRLAVALPVTYQPEIWFSTTRGWYDTGLQRNISPGDLLSTTGRVVRTNAQLLRRFNVTADLGLDAIFIRIVRPDFNLDGSVDLLDFVTFQRCFNGPNQPVPPECADADVDDDGDVDLQDFRQFQAAFTGPIAQQP